MKQTLTLCLCGFLVLAFCGQATASDNQAEEVNSPPVEMNGIHFGDYPDFEDNWKLVTVRYRIDNKELRFVYANPRAYQTLMSGKIDYPDGAIFAKIAMKTDDDSAFINSKIPSEWQHFQFMVRDKTKYASTDGWGFAIFSPADKKVVTPKIEQETAGCVACHEVVKERGMVFSIPAPRVFSSLPETSKPRTTKLSAAVKFPFVDQQRDNLPPAIRDLIPTEQARIRLLSGALQKHFDHTAIGEVRPTLIHETQTSGRPALFMSQNTEHYILVFLSPKKVLPDSTECPDGQKVFETFSTEHFSNIGQYFCD